MVVAGGQVSSGALVSGTGNCPRGTKLVPTNVLMAEPFTVVQPARDERKNVCVDPYRRYLKPRIGGGSPVWVDAPCGKCLACDRAKCARGYVRLQRSMERVVEEGMAAWRCSREDYLFFHCRMLTTTVGSDDHFRDEVYSVMDFALHLDALQTKLRKVLYTAVPPVKPEHWVDVEPQGPGTGWRLHVHHLLFNVPAQALVWDGPKVEASGFDAGREIDLEQWLREIDDPKKVASASFARWLLGSHFWGVNMCSRITDEDGALRYVTKELTTGDFIGQDSRLILNWAQMHEVTGRRIRKFRYSSAFRGVFAPGAEKCDLERMFLKRVPLWEQVKVVPNWRKVAEDACELDGRLFSDDETLASKVEIFRQAHEWALSRAPEEIERYLGMTLAADRLDQRYRSAQKRWFKSQVYRPREELPLLMDELPSDLVAMRSEAESLRLEAFDYRDRLGMPKWFDREYGTLRRYAEEAR